MPILTAIVILNILNLVLIQLFHSPPDTTAMAVSQLVN